MACENNGLGVLHCPITSLHEEIMQPFTWNIHHDQLKALDNLHIDNQFDDS